MTPLGVNGWRRHDTHLWAHSTGLILEYYWLISMARHEQQLKVRMWNPRTWKGTFIWEEVVDNEKEALRKCEWLMEQEDLVMEEFL